MCEYDKKYELQNSLDLSSGGQEAGDPLSGCSHLSPFIQYSSDHFLIQSSFCAAE